MQDTNLPPRVGEVYSEESYILHLPDFFKGVSWCPHCHKKFTGVVPESYFITSGEGVVKAEKLYKDAAKLMGEAQRLLNSLKRTKGPAKYLEVTQEGGLISAKRRYPRAQKIYLSKKPPLADSPGE